VPMATGQGPTDAAKFVLRGIATSLGFFGLLRLNWTATHVVLPLTREQSTMAMALFGSPRAPVDVTLACSGSDALALCLGAVLAYPAPWPMRLAGASVGTLLIVALNTARIGTLGQAAASPAWFNALHLYLWPAVLIVAIAGYVFTWMQLAGRAPRLGSSRWRLDPSRRFVVLALVLLASFVAAAPLYLESPRVLAVADLIAHASAAILGAFGMDAHAAANVLWTSRGGFLVTQECIATPLIPLYLAAIGSYSTTWTQRIAGVLATLPIFIALGIARLLVVAVPDVVASPLFLVHAFYQLLLGAVVVLAAAWWRHGRRKAFAYASAGIVVGVLFVHVLGPVYAQGIAVNSSLPSEDPQGAIALLPSFQVGLYLALWVAAFLAVAWKRVMVGLVLLAGTQVAGLLAVQSLYVNAGLLPHVRDIRGWAIAGPVLIFAMVMSVARPRE
jgi:exosortase/archaeosortase family protein